VRFIAKKCRSRRPRSHIKFPESSFASLLRRVFSVHVLFLPKLSCFHATIATHLSENNVSKQIPCFFQLHLDPTNEEFVVMLLVLNITLNVVQNVPLFFVRNGDRFEPADGDEFCRRLADEFNDEFDGFSTAWI